MVLPQSPLAFPHILHLTLSHLPAQALARCMRVHSTWYIAATKYLWKHISYRVNRFLTDPGVTPFLPVPDEMVTLRRVKHLAVKGVKVVDVRVHECSEVGCAELSLHGEEQIIEGDEGHPVDSTTFSSISVEEDGHCVPETDDPDRAVIRSQADSGTIPAELNETTSTGGAQTISQINDSKWPTAHWTLPALRIHLEDGERRHSFPFPCPLADQLDARTIVIVSLRRLALHHELTLPSPPSLRKVVILMTPPTGPPGTHKIYEHFPDKVEEVVLFLWRRSPSATYDNFGRRWARSMMGKRWGPQKIWAHWCNLVLSRPSGLRRKYTFVNTGRMDAEWLGVDTRMFPMQGAYLSDGTPNELEAEELYTKVQDSFQQGMRACLARKLKERGTIPGMKQKDDLEEYLSCMSFINRDEYLSRGGWEGEFTLDEVMYHG